MGQQITKAEQHSIQSAPTSNFSGKANFSRYPVMPSQGDVAPASIVNFDAGTITNWHTHPTRSIPDCDRGRDVLRNGANPSRRFIKAIPSGVHPMSNTGTREHSAMSHIAMTPVATGWQERDMAGKSGFTYTSKTFKNTCKG